MYIYKCTYIKYIYILSSNIYSYSTHRIHFGSTQPRPTCSVRNWLCRQPSECAKPYIIILIILIIMIIIIIIIIIITIIIIIIIIILNIGCLTLQIVHSNMF